ncbi:MAG: peptidoglycan editing factor PgeF [Oscillospiraceae bacterium]|nr:peptidoglycan editing factor PgeF [Oscillospiraceae bacterium]
MSIITKKNGALEYLVAEEIPVPHGFTTRLGGVSTGSQGSLNLAYGRGDSLENVEKNLRILADALGFDPEKYVLTRQIHSDTVRAVTEEDCRGFCHRDYPECDALVTNTPGVTLTVFTADCTPILFHDPVTGAVGAAHAGWRGTVQAIAAKTVEAMVENFGCRPEDIRAAIGPNLGQCHFETDLDVPAALLAAFGEEIAPYIRQSGEKYFPDLKQINAWILRRAGVRRIEISGECTWCQSQRFWSHRVTKGDRGSQGAVITCREVEK